jgi:6,7-dimethyl-8-ribityllumazine synthase
MTSTNETAIGSDGIRAFADRVGTFIEPSTDGTGLRIGIVCGRFNGGITARLLDATLTTLTEKGVAPFDITVVWVPGAVEIPFAASLLTTRVDAVIALGAVIRGDTGHYDVVVETAQNGLLAAQVTAKKPMVLGILTVENDQQALDRSRPDASNKGHEFAMAAIEMVNLAREF